MFRDGLTARVSRWRLRRRAGRVAPCRFRKVRFVHIDGVATEDRLGDNGLQPPSRLVCQRLA